MLKSEEIKDISNTRVSDEYLINLACEGTEQLHRFNKEQFMFIVGRVDIPWQVERYNRAVEQKKREDMGSQLHPDKQPIQLEDILPKALGVAERMYDDYASLAPGTFYSWMCRPFDENVTWHDVKMKGSPAQWIAMKQFQGFVTRTPEFNYAPLHSSSFDAPDWEVYIPWELDGAGLIHVSPYLKFSEISFWMNERELRENLAEHDAARIQLYKKITPEGIEEDIAGLKQWEITLEEIAESRGIQFGSWNEYAAHYLSERSVAPRTFEIYLARAQCEKIGFIPKTREVSSLQELSDFVVRFTSGRESGIPYSEENYQQAFFPHLKQGALLPAAP